MQGRAGMVLWARQELCLPTKKTKVIEMVIVLNDFNSNVYKNEGFMTHPSYPVQVIQKEISPQYSPLVQSALARHRSIVVLPEYFYFDQSWRDPSPTLLPGANAKEDLRELSRHSQSLIIAGSVVEPRNLQKLPQLQQLIQSKASPISELGAQEPLVNRSYVYYQGEELGAHTKFRLFRNETSFLTAGEGPTLIKTPLGILAILICADVLEPGIFEQVARLAQEEGKPFLGTFCPTTSPRKEESEETRRQRDLDIYVHGARTTGAPVFKSCSVGSIRGNPIQGRSLIARPNGSLVNAQDIDQEEVLTEPLNIPKG